MTGIIMKEKTIFLSTFQNVCRIVSIILIILFTFCSSENKDWEKARTENSIGAFKWFLENHPNSSHAPAARSKLETLYFNKAISTNNIEALKTFLKKYPGGPYVEKAQFKIEQLYLKKAQARYSIPAYKDFIKKFPQSSLKAEAESLIKKLYNERHPAVKNARTARILVEQYLSKGKKMEFGPKETIRRFFKRADIEMLEDDQKDYDLLLKITIWGTPVSERYSSFGWPNGAKTLFTGANVKGSISFSNPKNLIDKKSFSGFSHPTGNVLSSSITRLKNPANAPFHLALNNSEFYQRLLETFVKTFGPHVVHGAQRDENEYVKVLAYWKLDNQKGLADLAKKSKWYKIRIAAAEKLTDQKILTDIAKNDSREKIRNAAKKRLKELKAK
jgi:hypothetical protein